MTVEIGFLCFGSIISIVIASYAENDSIKGFFGTLALILAFIIGSKTNNGEKIIYKSELSSPSVKLEIVDGDTILHDTTYVYTPTLK